jgi:hypothetical protein
MVKISSSGSGEGPGWATAPGYSTAAFLAMSDSAPCQGADSQWVKFPPDKLVAPGR